MEKDYEKLKHKLNNYLSVISLSTYKLGKIAEKYNDSELTEIVFKLKNSTERIKEFLKKEKIDE